MAVRFEPGVDEVAFTDGVDGFVGADTYVYRELTRRPKIRSWLGEHAINLGNSEQGPTHWLLIDRTMGQAHICDVAVALDHVWNQILDARVG